MLQRMVGPVTRRQHPGGRRQQACTSLLGLANPAGVMLRPDGEETDVVASSNSNSSSNSSSNSISDSRTLVVAVDPEVGVVIPREAGRLQGR